MNRLAGKVAVITGTAGGQGRAAALLSAAETVELVRAAGGVMDSTHPLDLGDEDGVQAWIVDAAARHGGIDILYNNAAATRFSPIADNSDVAPVQGPAASSPHRRPGGGRPVRPLPRLRRGVLRHRRQPGGGRRLVRRPARPRLIAA